MHVLIVGASGFIGRHLAARLVAEGVSVTAAGRAPNRLRRRLPGANAIRCDLATDRADDWRERLAGVDAVVNCAGLFGDDRGYANVHAGGPIALFDACRTAGVSRVLQISALGAAADAPSAYHRSKAAADDHLAGMGDAIGWAIVRPSLVIGHGGQSSALFTTLAALPVTPDLGRADGLIQPIHVDDLVEVLVRLLHASLQLAARIDAVGPEPMTTAALVATMRGWLGLPDTIRVTVPRWLIAGVARLGIGPVTSEGLAMLVAGNTASVEPLVALTGFRPTPIAQALARRPASEGDLRTARLAPIAPILRVALALVWFAGGAIPLFVTPAATNMAWMARVGLSGSAATIALCAGALADIAVGAALLLRIRGAALAGIALMATYTLILTRIAPELWADPFGPLAKNIAVLALSLAVNALETRHG
ncbi:NAD-dependent dehydratase [Sphingomonas sp. Leaf67]|uniref:SDR family oxidoreductase n=1 Tax=unclassified Sphingomonas TaxID=196159 RepID=UPI0006F356DF|nr:MULTISPECIES: SDR family oxidoreductase [unclassified Sphingomonas]KQN71251.1 NAD-dependent dehydratase [Sphingomonas sp. Leaf62]KQN82254.1 NAD-dependent dehydratase [Sphingomonas sp. Leaf67]